MRLKNINVVYFSPTGTTKKVVLGITKGIPCEKINLIDITTPDGRVQPLITSEDELLLIGVPVYMGRVPALIVEWLNKIQAHNTPSVCVVVYGNRTYEDALLELKNIVISFGGIPIAGGAYIGEHSFSTDENPTAKGRPNENDLNHAEEFGRKILRKMQSARDLSDLSEVIIPGTYPYRGDSALWTLDFIEVNDLCIHCGICSKVCPVGAVDPQNSSEINTEICITCCACIKSCENHARKIKPGLVKDASIRLNTLYKDPKVPEYYI